MKLLLTAALFLSINICHAQVKLQEKDLTNLVAIGELYSSDTNGEQFIKQIESLRTPTLKHLVEGLIAINKKDKTIVETRFLTRPDNNDLVLWYVIREIHYNKGNKRPNIDVVNEILSKAIDERWLLDNYYYRIHSAIASLFNEADLSKYDVNIESLGFKNETEKGIFFLHIIDALIGQRFRVLQMMKNYEKVIEFAERLPQFNGKDYYEYKSFDYDDFEWPGYGKTELYNPVHIGGFYNTLMTHFSALASTGKKKAAQEIYYSSILHEPQYFHYSPMKDVLQTLYNQSKK